MKRELPFSCMTREEWSSIKWGSQGKNCGADCWNEAYRIQEAFDRYPKSVEYLKTDYVGTGLWADVVLRFADGSIKVCRVQH